MENLIRQLVSEEGEVLHAYEDHLGFVTIGVGRLIDKRKGGGITKEESRYLLANDVKKYTDLVSNSIPFYSQLNEARQAVLVGMAFQMGIGGLMKFKNTLKAIEAGRYKEAGNNMLNSLWARQTPARARRMAKQMEIGEWQFK
jgi:lysozyme